MSETGHRGRAWWISNCTFLPNHFFLFKGSLVDPRMRAFHRKVKA